MSTLDKRHGDVLRSVRQRIEESGEWGKRNFALSSYLSEQGKEIPVFVMSRDGYTFIVGKLTGKLLAFLTWGPHHATT